MYLTFHSFDNIAQLKLRKLMFPTMNKLIEKKFVRRDNNIDIRVNSVFITYIK